MEGWLLSSTRDLVTSSVLAGATHLSAFFAGRVAAVVELVRRRHAAAGLTAADTPVEAARDAVSPAPTGELPASTVDCRLASCFRAVDVPSRHVGGAGVVLRLAVEALATGQQTKHTA